MQTQAPHDPDEKIVVSATDARGAVVSGRVITVLVVSLLLAGVAMIALLSYFYSFPFRLFG